ncbi:hypothetical protein OSB04_022513, partial [Centaurea solstitialis]
MVQHKAQLKKQQKQQKRGGVDFKKIKRKIGRKLPPPKNTTNTQVKSKAIVLPEQSLVSDKGGLAVSKKGLTLKELLQQTSHHNAKVRRDALIGIRDIFLKHPAELKMHRLSVIEKLRERMSDEDKLVRETLYQLLKAVIFPGCKEDNQGTFISLIMAYVFNAMTHLAIDVRLMAFKFFDLVVQHYPISFSMYAEKIIQHYKEILQKNQFNLHDKGKLKSVLAGLAYCLSLLPCNKADNNSSTENVVDDQRILHSLESEVHEDHSVTAKELKNLLPILVGGLQDFMPSVQTMPILEAQSFDCVLSILKSIDFVVKFFVYGNSKSGQHLQVPPPSNRRDLDVLQKLLKKLFDVFPLNQPHQSSEKDDNRYFVLNVIVSEIFFCLSDWSAPPSAFLEKFLVFIVDALSEKVCSTLHSGKAFFQKHSLPLIPFIPKLIMQVDDTWKSHILQAFTEVFKKCDPESSMKLVCLSAIEEMLFPRDSWLSPNRSDSGIINFQITWIREIPLLLILLGDKNSSLSKAVLRLQLHLGQCVTMNSPLSQELDGMQYSLREFYSTCHDGSRKFDASILHLSDYYEYLLVIFFFLAGNISYGPFMKLATDVQELSVCCLYYFSFLDPSLLQSVAACCLCQDLEPCLLFRFLEVVNSAYKAGHIQIVDYISFLVTLLARYQVFPESSSHAVEKCGKPNSKLFRSVTSAVCSCLSQIGDDCLVLKMLEGVVVDLISIGAEDRGSSKTIHTSKRHYYVLPCFLLFYRSEKLLKDVMNVLTSLTFDGQNGAAMMELSSRIIAVVRVLLLMHEDVRIWQILSCYKQEIDSLLLNILRVMSDEGSNMDIEEKHKVQCAYDELKTIIT